MPTLEQYLGHLADFLRRDEHALAWDAVRFIEDNDVDRHAGIVVARGAMRSIEAYRDRFEELRGRGYAWLNLSAVGVVDGILVVCVEVPRSPGQTPPERVRVNLSGPERRVIDDPGVLKLI